jgi:hypothetical protein
MLRLVALTFALAAGLGTSERFGSRRPQEAWRKGQTTKFRPMNFAAF